jgi:flagellar biosynthesis protein FlhB
MLRLTDFTRWSIVNAGVASIDHVEVIMKVHSAVLILAWPLAAGLLSFTIGSLLAHHLQVRAFWAAGLLAPKLARLWSVTTGQVVVMCARRVGWILVETSILFVAASLTIFLCWSDAPWLSDLASPALTSTVGEWLLRAASMFGATLLLLGLADFGLRRRRFEKMLRVTRQQQREDQRVVEGDRKAKAVRRQLASAWRKQ